ncbi:MAG TPA: phosphatase PAP2 family protein [Anaerolineales bacterium]|nr:phosphatase PAP2 family protein [Anaerolineales bacterium]
MQTLRKYFREGIFGTGWRNALISVVLAAAVYFTNEIYDLLNHGPAVWILRTPLDDALPVVKPFVIPYVSLNYVVYFTLIVFLLFRTKVFHSASLAMITAFFVSYFFYFFFQTEVIRPVLTGSDFFTRMIQTVYAGDNPYNDFPSLHTSISTLLAIHWFRFDRRAGIVASIWTVLIVASTVLIKQHYLADVASGLALAFLVSWLYNRLILPRQA